MKLHIGSGNKIFDGWENVDIFSHVPCDVYSNALALPYKQETFDLIYASHVLEHFNRHVVQAALCHWASLLKPNGILRISVPNFDAIVKFYRETDDIHSIMGLLYGGQKFFLDNHCIVFNYNLLKSYLEKAGCYSVRFWDWRTTEHSQYDDYSQAYLPHMNKENGTIMSLNLEAQK